jgi:hypothetical protein
MRLFQNSAVVPTYRARLTALRRNDATFEAMIATFLADRFGAMHFLQPVLNRDTSAFFTNGEDAVAQRTWAREQGMKATTPLGDILLAQIEAHRADVFYNLDPITYGGTFVRRLPGCVRRRIAWRAAPSPPSDFTAYDLMVCNFPSILRLYKEQGIAAHYFWPAHDPVLDAFAVREDRPVDVLFVGGYSRHHSRRAAVLESVARLGGTYRVEFALDRSQMTRLAESPLGLVPPLRKFRPPAAIRTATRPAVFGLDLYRALTQAKIVLNGAIDMAGADRGNMRCWEAMGSGAAMASDAGVYPAGMEDGTTMRTYDTPQSAADTIAQLLQNPDLMRRIAGAGRNMIRERYSKSKQWQSFQDLAG